MAGAPRRLLDVDERGRRAVLGAISLDVNEARQTGEIGYWCGPWARGRGVMTAAVRLRARLGVRRPRPRARSRSAPTATTSRRSGWRLRPASAARACMRSFLTARGIARDDVLYGMVPGDPRPARRANGGPATPRLAAARRTAGCSSGRSSRTTPRPCRRPATTRTSRTGSSGCRRRTRWRTPTPFISDARRRLVADESARLAIEDAETGELLGSVGIDLFADRQAAEVGYWVKREARRRGVALAAARLVIDWAFAEVGRGAPRAAHLPRQRGLAGARPPSSASRASACCAGSSSRARQEP